MNTNFTVWLREDQDENSWLENLKPILTSNVLQDILSVKQPSDIDVGRDYMVFKTGIRPLWEDPVNLNGGRLVLTLTQKYQPNYDLNRIWGDICTYVVEERLPNSDQVCGLTLRRREHNKISIWLKVSTKEVVFEIGTYINQQVAKNFGPQYKFYGFFEHKNGYHAPPKYTL